MSTEKTYGVHQLTFEQASELVAERSNGYYNFDHAKPNLVEIGGEWCLAELEGLAVLLRINAEHAGVTLNGFAESEYIIDNTNVPIRPYGFTMRQAQEFIDHRKSGQIDGELSSSKGGRGWFDGWWDLPTLEALCILLRGMTDGWDGAPERLKCWNDMDQEEDRKEEE